MAAASYQVINLTANLTLVWAFAGVPGTVLMDNNKVIPTAGGFKIIMPDATLGSDGQFFIFSNTSAYSYGIYAANGTSLITSVLAGEVYYIFLEISATTSGTWGIYPFGAGTSALSFLEIESTNGSITVTNGIQTPPGGTINLSLPASLVNLNALGSIGIPVITAFAPLTWRVATLVAGTNISITNANGVSGNPIINLATALTNLVSAEIGDMTLTAGLIASNITNGGVALVSDGTGKVAMNGVQVDTSNNITGVHDLTITGTFNKAITGAISFTDVITGMTNVVTLTQRISCLSSFTGSNGTYSGVFTTPQANANYCLIPSLASTGGGSPLITHIFWTVKTTTGFTIIVTDASGVLVTSVPNGASLLIV